MTHSQQLPGIDRKKSLRLVPQAGNTRHPSEAPSRRLKRRTKRKELGTPEGETHRERSDPGEATIEGPEDSPETTAPEPKDPTDPKSGEGKSGANSSAGGPLEPDVTERTATPEVTATSKQEALRRTEFVGRGPQPGDAIWRRRSQKSLCIDDHPEIKYHRRRREVGPLRVDHDPQLVTKGQDSPEIPEEGLPGRCLDEPVVPAKTHTDTQGMKNGYRCHNPREDLRGHGQTEAQRIESVSAARATKRRKRRDSGRTGT